VRVSTSAAAAAAVSTRIIERRRSPGRISANRSAVAEVHSKVAKKEGSAIGGFDRVDRSVGGSENGRDEVVGEK
jgi:hypothetical protein